MHDTGSSSTGLDGIPSDWAKSLASDGVFEDEQRCLAHTWTFLGLTCDIPKDGDWFRSSIAGRSVFVQRFGSELRSFENRCAHRFYPLRNENRGNGPLICGFHGWRYDPDGRAIGIPQCREVFGVTPRELRAQLVRLEITTCGMMVFGRFPATGLNETLRDFLGDGFDVLATMCPLESRPQYLSATVQANWKLCIHASLDDYHLVSVHPSTFGKTGPIPLKRVIYHRFASHLAYFYTDRQRPFETMLEACRGDTFKPNNFCIFHLAPYTLLAVFPTPLQTWYCAVVHYEPLARDRSTMHAWFYPAWPFASEARWRRWLHKVKGFVATPIVRYYAARIFGEDHRVCERLQTNASRMSKTPILSALESRIYWFEQTYRRLVAQGRKFLLSPPSVPAKREASAPVPPELLHLMQAVPGAERRKDGYYFSKSLSTGTALYGPYLPFPGGWHRIAVRLTWKDLDVEAKSGLLLEVATDSGKRVLAFRDLPANQLRELGHELNLELCFYMPRQLAEQPIEIRIWRQTAIALSVERISLLSTYLVGNDWPAP